MNNIRMIHTVAVCDSLVAAVPYLNRTNNRYKIINIIGDESFSRCVFEVAGVMADRELRCYRDDKDGPMPTRFNVQTGSLQESLIIWRTAWSVYYRIKREWIPIIDASKPELIPGAYIYSIKRDTIDTLTSRVNEQHALRSKIMMYPPRHIPVSVLPSAPPVPRVPSAPPPPAPPTPINSGIVPSFIGDAIKNDAITKGSTCPISLDDFKRETPAILTNCYHLFNKTPLEEWLRTHPTCPVCMARITSQQVL